MTLNTETRSLVTVITEAALEDTLLRDFDHLGVRGYTVSNARGKGGRGVRDATWDEAANIRIEVICRRDLAERLLAHLQERYYANYAMVTFFHDIEVLRPEKF